MRKDGARVIKFKDAMVFEVVAGRQSTRIEFRESFEKRATVLLDDWAVCDLVRQLVALPSRRAANLAEIRAAFTFAAESVKEQP